MGNGVIVMTWVDCGIMGYDWERRGGRMMDREASICHYHLRELGPEPFARLARRQKRASDILL